MGNKRYYIPSFFFKLMIPVVILTGYLSFSGFDIIKPDFASDEVKWMTFEEAVQSSQKEKRKIFVDTYTEWCGWCKKMDATTFSNPVIAKILNEKYYPVKFDAESTADVTIFNKTYHINKNGNSRATHELAIELLEGKMSYPSVVFLNEDFQRIQVIPGYLTPENLEPMLVFIGDDLWKTNTWQEFSEKFISSVKL